VYSGDDHPIVVTDTGSHHAFATQHGDEVVVGEMDEDMSEEISQELGELGSWLQGATFFLDSEHDINAAWEANQMHLQ
jgi:NADPH:quinone reductase-like Zn-dependent oxidoreductase